MLLLVIGTLNQNNVQAQENQSRYEKIQKRKNKANRRLKRRGDKAKKARRSYTKVKRKYRQGDKAYQGDIAGRKVRSRISPSRRSRAVHPQPNPYAGRKRQTEASRAKAFNRSIRYSKKPREKAWKGNISGNKLLNKGFRSKKRRLSPQTSPYVKNKRKGDKPWKGNISGGKLRFKGFRSNRKRVFDNKPNYQSQRRAGEQDGARFSGQGFKGIRSISGRSTGALKARRVVPRSASGNYTVRKKKKPYAIREKSKWESAYKGDITGRKFRTKRTTERPSIQGPGKIKYSFQGKGRKGDQAYSGQITGGYRSIRPPRERAWKKDISGHKLRIRTSKHPKFNAPQFKPYYQRKRRGDQAYKGKIKGRDFKTAGRPTERAGKRPIPVKPPGPNFEKSLNFSGNIKATKPAKGAGGSISGRWNNNGRPIQGKGFGVQDQRIAKFQGNLKGGKPLKGGGSISGQRWNNNGRPIQGRGLQAQDQRVAKFQGNIKAGKPKKGGGSISGQRWNNNGRAIQGRGYRDQDQRIAKFQGNIKAGKPKKGGGSISGQRWNNNGQAIQGRGYRDQDQRIAKFQGNLKQRRKGEPTNQDKLTAGHTGKIKRWKYQTGPLDEMKFTGRFKRNYKPTKNPNAAKESLRAKQPKGNYGMNYTGNLKQWKYKTGPLDEMKYEGRFKRTGKYKRNPNSSKEALIVKAPEKGASKGLQFQGRFKSSANYKRNPNSSKEALLTKAPKTGKKEMNFQGRFKVTTNYKHNPNASKEALPGKAPLSATTKAMRFQGRFKQSKNYKAKPNAAKGSLKGIGPSKAAISASNFQGSIKFKKGSLGKRHPSYKFDHPKNTVVDKTKFSLKLLWSKLFKKSENQPAHLKEKVRKPRYDKGEEGLWND